MWKFIKIVLAVLVALVVFFVLMISVLMGIVAAAGGSGPVVVNPKTVLVIELNKPILERDIDNPLEELDIPLQTGPSGIGLIGIKKALRRASEDPNIDGIVLKVDALQAGFASVQEIRDALLKFKTSGKFVYAYSEVYSENAYYLCSAADKLYLNPSGLLEFNGIGSRGLYLKGALQKLEIKPEIFRVGKYKSAVEPLILDKMSDENRTQTMAFINSIYDFQLKNIAESRGIDKARLRVISDSMLVRNASDALKYGLVDDVLYYDQFLEVVKQSTESESSDKIATISLGKYMQQNQNSPANTSENKIAVIIAQGDIVSGKGDEESVGSEELASELRKARLDSTIKAIVLRINSPGGSAMASDVMWREVVLTQKAKPIIASMGDVAASGGYYIAMGCSKIVARENSITGSIGVFGILFNMQNFLKNKLGITADGAQTGRFTDIGNPTRELTEYERKSIQSEVEGVYRDFVQKAAEGRKMKYTELDELASGRVYSGIQALENRLIDQLGGLDESIELAAKEAKLDSTYQVIYLPREKSFFERIVKELSAQVRGAEQKALLGESYKYLYGLRYIQKMEGIQARHLYTYE